MLLSGKRTDALCFCVQSLPLAERLQLKGQLRAAHNGMVVVVKVFVVIAGQRTGFLRRDDAELGENREDGIRDDGGGAVLHFEGNADPLIFDAHGIECAGTRFAEDEVAEKFFDLYEGILKIPFESLSTNQLGNFFGFERKNFLEFFYESPY